MRTLLFTLLVLGVMLSGFGCSSKKTADGTTPTEWKKTAAPANYLAAAKGMNAGPAVRPGAPAGAGH